jgi:hypothetical protein
MKLRRKFYSFDITINLTDIGVEADNEEEARSKLTEQVADYFTDTQISISAKEAKLVDVTDEDGNRVTDE